VPYSKSPSVSTYETKRQNFVIAPQHRTGSDLTKDSRLVNMIVEVLDTPDKQNQRIYAKSRPGLSTVWGISNGEGRGCYYWVYNNVGYTISVAGANLYYNDQLLLTLATTTGTVGFTEHVSSLGIVTLFMCDGTNGYIFTSPTVAPTLISSALETAWTASTSISTGAKCRPTVDNGKVYTAIQATVANTGASQPTWPTTIGATVVDGGVTWSCGELAFPSPHIPAPLFLDGYIFLAKANSEDIYNSDLDNGGLWTAGNFISAEMYPDKIVTLSKNNNYIYAVGTSSVEYFYDAGGTTTPLARHDSAVQQFGTPAADSVVQTEKEVVLVGATSNGGHTVWTIDGFKENEIGTPSIRGILRAEGATLTFATAFSLRSGGQKLYVLCLSNIILVYSFDTQMWYEWTSSYIKRSCDGPNGTPYIQSNTGLISAMSEDFHSDNGGAYTCQIITPKYDFDVYNLKTCSRFSLLGDTPSTTSTVLVSWTDNDYSTWVADRTITFNLDFFAITQLGSFRRRAFRISFTDPSYGIRLEGFEIDINKGTQ